MKHRSWLVLGALFVLAVGVMQHPAVAEDQHFRTPSYVSKYDFATRDDMRYLRLLDRFIGDSATPEKWRLFKQIKKKMIRAIHKLDQWVA